jgi:hypothetical protein
MNPADKVISLDYDSTVDGFVQTVKQKVPSGTIPVLDLHASNTARSRSTNTAR